MRADLSNDSGTVAEMSTANQPGRVIAVIGPSGVGKDSVMAGLQHLHPKLSTVRRTITRPAGAGGEDHEPVSIERFIELKRSGAFVLSWNAHDFYYGIPSASLLPTEAGRDVLVNLSRAVLSAAASRFASLEVLHLWAEPDILAERLRRRGREGPNEVAGRLARHACVLPAGLRIHDIDNSGSLAAAVDAASRALYQHERNLPDQLTKPL